MYFQCFQAFQSRRGYCRSIIWSLTSKLFASYLRQFCRQRKEVNNVLITWQRQDSKIKRALSSYLHSRWLLWSSLIIGGGLWLNLPMAGWAWMECTSWLWNCVKASEVLDAVMIKSGALRIFILIPWNIFTMPSNVGRFNCFMIRQYATTSP